MVENHELWGSLGSSGDVTGDGSKASDSRGGADDWILSPSLQHKDHRFNTSYSGVQHKMLGKSLYC